MMGNWTKVAVLDTRCDLFEAGLCDRDQEVEMVSLTETHSARCYKT